MHLNGNFILKIFEKMTSTNTPTFPVANLGGGRKNSISVLEIIAILKDDFDLNLSYQLS